jgi:enoyl-CoA hydratase/carnithine racemase
MAEVRYELDRQDRLARLLIDTAGPVNAIAPAFVADLEAAFDRALSEGARAVVLAPGSVPIRRPRR